MKASNFSPETKVAHLGRDHKDSHGFVNLPIYHGSTVLYETYDEFRNSEARRQQRDQVLYGRYGTPLSFALENAIAELEGANGAITVSSGLAAITESLKAFLSQGDHILVTDSVYQPTRKYCNQVLSRFGVEATYFDPLIGGDIKDLIKQNTSVIFVESPGSQTFEIQDLPAIAEVAKENGITTILDNTWATPLYLKPFDLGIDVSVHAATKYITGHSDTMLGIISTNEACYERIRNSVQLSGQCAGPDTIFLGLRGLRTMPTRLKQHWKSGVKVAEWLAGRPEVARLIHPALPSHPGHELWRRDFTGASGLFAFILHEVSDDAVGRLLENTQLFGMGYSWGGFESLLIPFDPRSYRTATEWNAEGPAFRIHVGLEDPDELISDLQIGFDAMNVS